MTLESETLFVVGESDELWCVTPNQYFVMSGLKNAKVGGWRVSMTNETLTILELEASDVKRFAVARSLDDMNQFWIKFEEDKFLALRGLKSVYVNYDTPMRRVTISLEFDCLPVTFEHAVSISLATKAETWRGHPFGDHGILGEKLRSQLKKVRPIPDPNTVVGPVDSFLHRV